MKKISALIFCRDDPEKAVKLAKDLEDTCYQIVLMDSSNKKNLSKLKRMINAFPKGMVDLNHILALGYPDPMRAYALGKCKHDWILYIDTDERITPELKKDLQKLVSGKYDAYTIKRYEHSKLDGTHDSFFTWQTRLYNKNKIYYRGLLHEQPIVKGKLKKLDEPYCMLHIDELKTAGSKRRDLEYSHIKKYYDRLSYMMLNERMKEYLEKLFMPENGKVEDTLMGKLVLGWMRFYQTLTFRKPQDEISVFDYFVFFSMLEGAYVVKRKDIKYLFAEAIPTISNDTRSAAKFKKEGKRIFEISQEVNKNGIIRYLMLDDEKTVETLYKKYKNGRQGIGLLMKLLEDRYEGEYP